MFPQPKYPNNLVYFHLIFIFFFFRISCNSPLHTLPRFTLFPAQSLLCPVLFLFLFFHKSNLAYPYIIGCVPFHWSVVNSPEGKLWKKLSPRSYQLWVDPQLGVELSAPALFMLGYSLVWTYVWLVYVVISTISSYVPLSCVIQKVVLPGSHQLWKD